MTKYPHGLTVLEICRAIDAYEAKQDDLPEQGMIDAFQILLSATKAAEEMNSFIGRKKTVEVSAIMEEHCTLLPIAITPDARAVFVRRFGRWLQIFPGEDDNALAFWSRRVKDDRKIWRGIFKIHLG